MQESNESNDRKQNFNDWLSKLEEINDMSRSTIDRIKKLENDIFMLRNNTEKLPKSSTQPIFVSKIPVNTNYSNTATKIMKRALDKSENTDIDMA